MKKKLSGKKEMSINDLALMVQSGFMKMDKRFIDLEERMDKRFMEMDKRFDIIEHKLIARHDKEIDHLRDRLLKVEMKLAKIS